MTTQGTTSTSCACRPPSQTPQCPGSGVSCAAPPGPEDSGQGRPSGRRGSVRLAELHPPPWTGSRDRGVDSLSSIGWSWTELSRASSWPSFMAFDREETPPDALEGGPTSRRKVGPESP